MRPAALWQVLVVVAGVRYEAYQLLLIYFGPVMSFTQQKIISPKTHSSVFDSRTEHKKKTKQLQN